jgi:hypothetical protein
MESAWRLIWALPLVLSLGAAAIILIRRVTSPQAPPLSSARLRLCESLQLSAETHLHLVEVDERVHLVIESTRPVVQHWPDTSAATAGSPAHPWLVRLPKARVS